MTTPIITDGTMERVVSAPRVVLPEASVFADRAARFTQLAAGHPMGDFLRFMGTLAQAQHETLGRRAAPALAEDALQRARDYGMPPLSSQSHARDPQWHEDWRDIAGHVARQGGLGDSLAAVTQLDTVALEALADRVLLGTTLDADAAAVPLVGAALQVYFTRLARSLSAKDLERFDVPTVCPACATRPVASVVRIGGERNNLRYLVCALCSTEWNMARIQCSACQADKGVHYLTLQAEGAQAASGTEAARKAEACDECKSYLKIFYQDKDPNVDAVADDLASLALDVLVDEQGYGRTGPNLLFHPGSG